VLSACAATLLAALPSVRGLAAEQPLAHLLACRALADPAARLTCFDRETARLDAQSVKTIAAPAAVPAAGPPSAPVAPAAEAAASTLDPKQQFGLPARTVVTEEVAAGRRAADAMKIEARLSSVSVGANGHIVFGLDNDQVWRQLANGEDLLARPGDAVTISRAALGSYWLKTASGRGCKVSRVR
jgi:pyruvate/2-oxoglutarate dehydrogenase complex dihydrolipoamide acyltransferase (E2) component